MPDFVDFVNKLLHISPYLRKLLILLLVEFSLFKTRIVEIRNADGLPLLRRYWEQEREGPDPLFLRNREVSFHHSELEVERRKCVMESSCIKF